MDVNKSIAINGNYIYYNGKKFISFDNNNVYSIEDKKSIATFSYKGEYTILNLQFGNKDNYFIKGNDKNIYRQKDLIVVAVSNVSVLGDLARLAAFLYKRSLEVTNKQVTKQKITDQDIIKSDNPIISNYKNNYPQKEEPKSTKAIYGQKSHNENSNNSVKVNSNVSGGIILFVLFAIYFCIAYVIATFIMISTTWNDIFDMFKNKDWFGIIIVLSFFTAGIVSLGNLFKKNKPKFLDCLSFLLIADTIAAFFTIIISIIFLIIDSSFKFVGLYIIDIPLCILGAISISFQIAFPIAIIIAIITGITCLIKKHL